MLRSFYSGISGLRNHQQAMDVVGNNLANVNTTGYKGSRTTFTDTLSQTVQGAQSGSSTSGGKNAMQVGLGMTVASIDRNMTQGALQSTGRNLDMAVEGEGWFVVGDTNPLTLEDSYYYTRAGNFFVDDSYNLVTSGGDFVFGWTDSDQSGTVDPASDEMSFINLDRRNDGSITNALASSTPPLTGPNLGDAEIKRVDVTPSTISDQWRVECVNAAQGWFSVTGTRSGPIGTFPYDAPIDDSRMGSFNVNMGPPAQARMTTSFVDGDGTSEVISFNNQSGNDYVVEFVSGVTGTGVQVTANGNDISVTVESDIDGNVISTFDDIVAAMTAQLPGVGVPVGPGELNVSASGNTGLVSNSMVNHIVNVPNTSVTDFDLGDVAPQGVLGWTANDFGAGGNNMNMVFLNRGAQQRTTEVVVDGSTISVYLAADSSGNVVATANDVYNAFMASTEATSMVTMDDPAAGGYGSMIVEPFNQLFFNGGSGANDGDYFTFNTTAPGGAELVSLSVNSEGGLIGVFENGSTEELARVSLAKIPNPQGMISVGQGKFAETPVSGSGFPPVVPGSGGTGGIASGFLEMSNVDLTREFTDMIVNQRGFQANSRIITTSDELLQELMSIKR